MRYRNRHKGIFVVDQENWEANNDNQQENY